MFLSWYIRMFSDYNRYNLCVRSFSIHFRMCVNNINRPFPFICWNDLFTLPCRILSDKSFLCRHGSILTPFPFTGRKYFDTVSVVLDVVFFLGLLTKIVYDLTQKLYHKYTPGETVSFQFIDLSVHISDSCFDWVEIILENQNLLGIFPGVWGYQ